MIDHRSIPDFVEFVASLCQQRGNNFLLTVRRISERLKMIGSFLTRTLILALGYAYPAYNCYKTVELNRPDIEKLRFWSKYWILIAILTVIERFSDYFISWLPMYGEAKLAFIVYLWHPKTNGTPYVYDTFLRPLVAQHEREIDRNLVELKTRATDIAAMYFSRALVGSQALIFDVIRYISTQPLKSRTSQAKDNAQEKQPATTASTSPVAQRTDASTPADRSHQDAETKTTEVELRKGDETEMTTEQESAMEDAIRLTRARLKKRIGSIGHGPNSGPNTPK